MITIRDLMYASKLKALREKTNAKQFYAASIIGIHCQQHYSDYESGKKHFSEEVIKKICEGFKVPIHEFKSASSEILDEMIHHAGLNDEIQTDIKRRVSKERQLYFMELERRQIEIALENARKSKALLELSISRLRVTQNNVSTIYLLV